MLGEPGKVTSYLAQLRLRLRWPYIRPDQRGGVETRLQLDVAAARHTDLGYERVRIDRLGRGEHVQQLPRLRRPRRILRRLRYRRRSAAINCSHQ
jgi:hypothetical protein